VGTTLARNDQGMKVFGGIFLRIHRANTAEYQLLAEQIAEYMPPEGYPFAYKGVESEIAHADFDGRVDILPVSDPAVSSSTQRIITSQLVLEMANQQPQLYDMRAVHERALSAARVPNPEELMKPEDVEPPRMGPIEENMAMQMGQPVKARPDEDHLAHQIVHAGWFEGQSDDDQKAMMPVYMAHQAEHKAWAYYAEMTQMLGGPVPAGVMEGQATELDPDIERQMSMAAAQATQLMEEQKPPTEDEAKAQAAMAEQQSKDMETQADIERDNLETEAEIKRKDAEAAAEIERKDTLALADIERRAEETTTRLFTS
jgi:hypothetical protein